MKNTQYNLETLGTVISSSASLETLLGMIGDLGLEILDVRSA